MKYEIEGSVLQILRVELESGEEIYSESGAMSWMSGNMEMESLVTVKFHPKGGPGFVAFAPSFPGKVLPLKITPESPMICQKDSFLAAETGVNVRTVFRKKLTVGFFGGEGFNLQKLEGEGMAFVEIDGEVSVVELKAGETLKVDTGSLAMFEPTVDYDVTMVKGIRNMMFGGEGLFLANMKGPGKVWLQSMPASSLAQRLGNFFQMKK
jgi:uncharacterized protein (TIGR00266 family)